MEEIKEMEEIEGLHWSSTINLKLFKRHKGSQTYIYWQTPIFNYVYLSLKTLLLRIVFMLSPIAFI